MVTLLLVSVTVQVTIVTPPVKVDGALFVTLKTLQLSAVIGAPKSKPVTTQVAPEFTIMSAGGVIVGLTRAATKAHLARAALEAICYQTRDVMDAMVADSGVPMKEMRVDGGITANSLCMQMQADVMGIDITRPLIGETTALGAAYAAGLAVGFWSSTDEVRKQWQQSRRWSATSTEQQRTVGYAGWKKAVERTLNWVD